MPPIAVRTAAESAGVCTEGRCIAYYPQGGAGPTGDGGTFEHLRITRKTVLALADEPDLELPAQPAPELPEHPAYQQIMAVFADEDGPLRARDLCLTLLPKHTEGTRSKLKCLVSRGILAEPGLVAQPRP
ncbi:hypothetical protein [Streptomyces sp. NPDC002851]